MAEKDDAWNLQPILLQPQRLGSGVPSNSAYNPRDIQFSQHNVCECMQCQLLQSIKNNGLGGLQDPYILISLWTPDKRRGSSPGRPRRIGCPAPGGIHAFENALMATPPMAVRVRVQKLSLKNKAAFVGPEGGLWIPKLASSTNLIINNTHVILHKLLGLIRNRVDPLFFVVVLANQSPPAGQEMLAG